MFQESHVHLVQVCKSCKSMWYLFGLWRFELSKDLWTPGRIERTEEHPSRATDGQEWHTWARGGQQNCDRRIHTAHIEALMRCIKGVTKKSAAQSCLWWLWIFSDLFREGCWRIFSERGSGLYFWASLSCRSWIFLAIYVSESSSDMNSLEDMACGFLCDSEFLTANVCIVFTIICQ